MIRILVFDTSVLIDLERGNLLEACFNLPFRFTVPDLLCELELAERDRENLIDLGLSIERLDDSCVSLAVKHRRRSPILSTSDSFVLALAQTRNWILLSGDRALRQLAEDNAVECHGVLWLLDRIFDENATTLQVLHDGLVKISKHPRCRLPNSEVKRRLQFYQANLNTQPNTTEKPW